MVPVWTLGHPAVVLMLGLGLISAPLSAVSGAPIPHKHNYQHRHFHKNAVAEDGHPSVDMLAAKFLDSPWVGTPYISMDALRAEENHEAQPTVASESTGDRIGPLVRPRPRPGGGPVLPPIPPPPRPQNSLDKANSARPLVRPRLRPGGGPVLPPIPPPPRPQNSLVKVAAGMFDRVASRMRLMVRSSGGGGSPSQSDPIPHQSGVSDSAVAFFLAAVGFFFLSLIWNLYIRYGWVRDKARQRGLGAMETRRLGSLGGESRGKGRGKARRSPGGWLRAANATPVPVAVV